MKSSVWISYDLGVRGDYEGLYAWLDDHDARECGENVAFLSYEHSGTLSAALKKDLAQAIDPTKQTRIYLIYRERETTKIKGIFLFGSRKAPPWSGYGSARGDSETDES